jgi:proteasome lid subunit RPN8/RPN11
MGSLLRLPLSERVQLEAWARRGYPREVCGLLVGHGGCEGCREVVAVRRARNLNTERAHDRFELDPQDFLATDRAARAAGLEIVGVWHTHPDHPARPSETDREAAWPEWSYLILAVGGCGAVALRSWRLAGEQFEEEEIES